MFNISYKTILYICVVIFVYSYLSILNKKYNMYQKLFDLKNNFLMRSIDMGIKLNPCSYEVVNYIKRNNNIKMFEQLIKLFSKINYDIKLPILMLLMKQTFNKPIVYGIKNNNITNTFNLEFYAYIGDHNITHADLASSYKAKLIFLRQLQDVLIKLYNIKPFVKSEKLLKFMKKSNLIIISFNISLDGKLIPKLNLYTENIVDLNGKKSPIILTFEFDLVKQTISYSNIGIPYATKNDMIKSNLVKSNAANINFIKSIPNASRYLIHKKDKNTISIYIVNPKYDKIRKFLIYNNFEPNIIYYFNKNKNNKSLDIAFTITNGKVIKSAIYDNF